MSEHFAIGLYVDGSGRAVNRRALDRIGSDQFDFPGEGLAGSDDGEKKQEIAQTAAGFKGEKSQVVTVEAGAGGETAERASEGSDADGKDLGSLLSAGGCRRR